MVTTVVLLLAVWAVTVPAVLGLARLLGRLSARTPAQESDAPRSPSEAEKVVALVPRPRNGLATAERRAA